MPDITCPECGHPCSSDEIGTCPSCQKSAELPTTAKPEDEPPKTSSLGIILMGLSGCVALGTAGLCVLLVASIFLVPAPESETGSATAASALGSLIGIAIWGAIGSTVSYGLFYLGRARLYPREYAVPALLQQIIDETTDVDSSEVTENNFYTGASDQELFQLYRSLNRQKFPDRLAAIAFEARYRANMLK